MADTLQFDLVSPERRLASLAATQVEIPGVAGDFTAMPNHAPFLTTLRPGVVRVHAEGGVQEFIVTGGFAEVSPDATSVLAERAAPQAEATAEMLAQAEADAEAALAEATDATTRVAGAQRLSDVRVLRSRLRL